VTPKGFEEPTEAFAHVMVHFVSLRGWGESGVEALQEFQGQVHIRPGVVEHGAACGRRDLP